MIKQKLAEASRVNLPELPDDKREQKSSDTALGIWWLAVSTGMFVVGVIVLLKTQNLYSIIPTVIGFIGGMFGSNLISREMLRAQRKTANTVARVADSAGGVIRRK